jgi:hypothetical protein
VRLFFRNKQAKTRSQVEELGPVENDPVSLFLEQKRLEAGDEIRDQDAEIPESSVVMKEDLPFEDQIPSGEPEQQQRSVREEKPLPSERIKAYQMEIKEDSAANDSFDPLLSLIRTARDAMLENEVKSPEKNEAVATSAMPEAEPVINEPGTIILHSSSSTSVGTLDDPEFTEEVISQEDFPVSEAVVGEPTSTVQSFEAETPEAVAVPEVVTSVEQIAEVPETTQVMTDNVPVDGSPESNKLIHAHTETKDEQGSVTSHDTVNEVQSAQEDNPPTENKPAQTPATSGILDIFREEVGDKGHGLAVELEEIDIQELLKEAIHVKNMLSRRSGISENE